MKSQPQRPFETKTFRMELKGLSDEGTFEGYLSVFGNKDCYGDIVEPGAFARTLKNKAESGKRFPILWQHDYYEPIGVFTEMIEDQKGLYVKGQLTMTVKRAEDAYALLKDGALDGLSIGYDVVKKEFKDGCRRLKEVKLYEGSLVTFPANDQATVLAVKQGGAADWITKAVQAFSGKAVDFNEALADVQDRRALWRLHCDIEDAWYDAQWDALYESGISAEERLSLLSTICDQYCVAYLAWARAYLKLPTLDETEERSEAQAYAQKRLPSALKQNLISLHTFIQPLLAENEGNADSADSHSDSPPDSDGPGAKAGENPANPADSDLHSADGLTELFRSIRNQFAHG